MRWAVWLCAYFSFAVFYCSKHTLFFYRFLYCHHYACAANVCCKGSCSLQWLHITFFDKRDCHDTFNGTVRVSLLKFCEILPFANLILYFFKGYIISNFERIEWLKRLCRFSTIYRLLCKIPPTKDSCRFFHLRVFIFAYLIVTYFSSAITKFADKLIIHLLILHLYYL